MIEDPDEDNGAQARAREKGLDPGLAEERLWE